MFNFVGKICHSLLPMNLAVSIPYVIILKSSKSVSAPLRRLQKRLSIEWILQAMVSSVYSHLTYKTYTFF